MNGFNACDGEQNNESRSWQDKVVGGDGVRFIHLARAVRTSDIGLRLFDHALIYQHAFSTSVKVTHSNIHNWPIGSY